MERISAPILLPTIARAPNKPKIAPDAPTDALYKDAKYADVKEPVKSEKKKTIKKKFSKKIKLESFQQLDLIKSKILSCKKQIDDLKFELTQEYMQFKNDLPQNRIF
mgnify:CR=1 FL=1